MYTDPDGEIIFTILSAIFCPSLTMAALQVDMAWMQGGFTSMANGGSFWSGAGKGLATGLMNAGLSFLNIPGAIPNGLLHAGGNVLSNGITNAMWGNNFWQGAGWQAGFGFIGGAYSGYQMAKEIGLNPLTGGLTLETKLKILLKNYNVELMSEIGEAGVGDVLLGTNKNLQGTGYRNSSGYMKNLEGDLVNGLHRQGRIFDISVDGYARFNNNKIYLSKRTVRQMWREIASAKETLFHEWYHARDFYTGYASFLHSKNSSNYINMLEFRAHSFNYYRLATPARLTLMEHYARLYWGLPGLF